MSQNVDIYETGLSSGASTPRHGASPSPAAAEIQWYEYDLQLAAELGKALLERNQDLESQLADAEKTIQSQQTEIQFLFQKLDTAKNLNESRMRIFEQVDTNAQDLEAVNRQLRHQSSIDQQTISRLTGSLREAESRCEKLENDVYDMKREMAEEAKRFRDRWRETKKKERRASNESMESDVDADDFILLGDVVHDKKIPSASARRDENVEDRIFDDLNVETSLVDSLSWYQAETERLNKELLAAEKKLAIVNAEHRSDLCQKMEENKSLSMMLEMSRSQTLRRTNSSDEDNKIRMTSLPYGPNAATPTTPTPTSSSCCSSGKVTRNVSFGEVTSLTSAAADVDSSDDEENVPAVVRRSIEDKSSRRGIGGGMRLHITTSSGTQDQPHLSSVDGSTEGKAGPCRLCGADMGDMCHNCVAKRISYDIEMDDSDVKRGENEFGSRSSYRVARLRDGALAYGSQNTLDRIGAAEPHAAGNRRGSASLMSEIGAQYYRLVEMYETMLLKRAESSLGQLTETDEGDSDDDVAISLGVTPLEENVKLSENLLSCEEKPSILLPRAASTPTRDRPKEDDEFLDPPSVAVPYQTFTSDLFSDTRLHHAAFCAVFVLSLPKAALVIISFVFVLALHSRTIKRFLSRSSIRGTSLDSPPSKADSAKVKDGKKKKKKSGFKTSHRSAPIPEWCIGNDDVPCGNVSGPFSTKKNDPLEGTSFLEENDGWSTPMRDLGRVPTPPSLVDQPESISLSTVPETHSLLTTSLSHDDAGLERLIQSPTTLPEIEPLPSSQSESSILRNPSTTYADHPGSALKPGVTSDWFAVSRSVQTEVSSTQDSRLIAESALRGEVIFRQKRGRRSRSRAFQGSRTSCLGTPSSGSGCVGRSRKCRSLILDEMLERSISTDSRDQNIFEGFDRRPPEYRELFREIFATLKKSVDKEMARPPTPPMASSV